MSAAERLVIEPLGKQHDRAASCCGIAGPDRNPTRRGVRLRAPRSRFGAHRTVTRSPAIGSRNGHRGGTAQAYT